MSVFAFDGSQYDLPATEEIRKEFDHDSGLENNGFRVTRLLYSILNVGR
jgi:hypothetical protein